jgi:hypothetical protein
MEILRQLHEAVHRKIPEFWSSSWIFHHDSNAAAHKAFSVEQLLALKQITEM